jgi:hypothetical protein
MKSVKQINIERLTKDDRTALAAALYTCLAQTRIIGDRALNYEGKIATELDLIELQLNEACESLRSFLGVVDDLDPLSKTAKLKPIVKLSV